LRGKARIGGCHGLSSAGGPLTLALSYEGGEREPILEEQVKYFKRGLAG
jgi:hypothetical protein